MIIMALLPERRKQIPWFYKHLAPTEPRKCSGSEVPEVCPTFERSSCAVTPADLFSWNRHGVRLPIRSD
jgi:hypothetical protein